MRDWQYFIVQHDTSKIMKKKHPNFHYCILKGILRHLRRIPYYLIKPILWSIGHTDTDIECQLIWNDVPFISTLQPHYLQFNFGRKYDIASYDYTLSQCFVHKCTYKYKPALLTQPQENFLQHLLKDTP